ncbi:putative tail fiber assembly protein [Salmonella phage SSBI34]|nr:putative tail fiber assembly protein [Salmonella phage SSBI34]
MRMDNFEVYTPEFKKFGEGVQYFKDSKGRDFYDSRSLFTKKYCVFFDTHGIVRGVCKSSEVTRGNPEGLSISDLNSFPKDFDVFKGIWKFDGKKISSCDFDPAITTKVRKEKLFKALSSKITPLQDAVELNEATDQEISEYQRLRSMRVRLMRISDEESPSDIPWEDFSGI